MVPHMPHVHRAEDAGRLAELVRLLGAEPDGNGLPVDRQPPLERRPLIHQLHGGQHNDPRDPGRRRATRPDDPRCRPFPWSLMATDVKLPRLGQGMESGVIVRWLKSEGDAVAKGEPLYELDTDKVTQEVESELDGVLTKIVVSEGDVEVGSTVAVIEADGAAEAPAESSDGEPAERAEPTADAARSLRPPPSPKPKPPPPSRRPPEARGPTAAGRNPGARQGLAARPADRARARGRPRVASGDWSGGGILADDVEQASAGVAAAPAAASAAAPLPPGEVEIVALTSIRKTIARRLTEAWSAPVFQLGVSADMTEVLALREQLVARLDEGGAKPTVNDVLVKLAGVALVRHIPVNATFTGEEIQRHPTRTSGSRSPLRKAWSSR